MHKKQLHFLAGFVLLAIVCFSCRKGEPVEQFAFGKVELRYLNFTERLPVKVTVDTMNIGVFNNGDNQTAIVPFYGVPLKIAVKDSATGAVLTDSSFLPKSGGNKFIFLGSKALNLYTFFTPPATPPAAEQARVQAVNRLMINGSGRKITFRFFTNANRTNTMFDSTAFALANVESGKLSGVIDLPAATFPPPLNTQFRNYYIKAYDAETNALLFDLRTGSTNAAYGRVVSWNNDKGKHYVIEVRSKDEAGKSVYDIFNRFLF